MKFFITGGSGFVGRSGLIPHLLSHGDVIIALARSDKAEQIIRDAAAKAGGSVSIVRGSLTSSADLLAGGMAGCDCVIHSAAKIEGWGPYDGFYETNVEGTKVVLEAARKAKVPRFVHIGTEAVLLHDARPIHLADESAPTPLPSFHAPYTHSKILAERAVLEANNPAGGLLTVVVRPRFVWGAGDTVNLPEILEAVDSRSWRFFSPRYKTSTCHVRNLAEGARLAAEKGRPGEAYFLTDGEYPDFEDFISNLIGTQGREKPKGLRLPYALAWALACILENIPFYGYGVTREAAMNRQALGLMARELTLVDVKARRELGYTSNVTISQGLKEMLEMFEADQTSRN